MNDGGAEPLARGSLAVDSVNKPLRGDSTPSTGTAEPPPPLPPSVRAVRHAVAGWFEATKLIILFGP
jgi:hypothetical protein